jgi:hypothetical protein
LTVRTNSAGQIATRANSATIDEYDVSTQGFTWARRSPCPTSDDAWI